MANETLIPQKSKESELCGPLTHKYGKIEGNELIWGRLILRMIGLHKFKKVAYFDSYLEANKIFYEWLEENK
jgi:hypothetical protein